MIVNPKPTTYYLLPTTQTKTVVVKSKPTTSYLLPTTQTQTAVVKSKPTNHYLLPATKTKTLVLKECFPPIAQLVQIQRGPPGADGNDFFREEFIPALGQTNFLLTHQVANPSNTYVFINGQKQHYGTSYNLSGSGSLLTFLNKNYQLDEQDLLEIYYQYS